MTPRVLHVMEALAGGTSRHLVDVVTHATDVDHEVVVPPSRVGQVPDETALARLEAAGAVIHLLPLRRTPWSPRNAESMARLVALVRRRRPTIVHGHSSIGGLLGRLVGTATRTPRVYTPNGVTNVRAGQVVERSLRRLTDRWVAVSASEGALAVRDGYADPAALVVVPNGIEIDAPPAYDLHEHLGLDRSIPLIGTISRLTPQKAPEDFVAAAALLAPELPSAHFVLIGGGEQRAEFDAAVARSRLGDRLHHIESLPGASAALPSLSVFVLTSRFEGGPYAPLEAMRAGTPVVLTDVVGSRDAIVDGETGVLVPVGKPSAMADAIASLLRDDTRRAAFIAAGRQRVREHFDVALMGARMSELYREINEA